MSTNANRNARIHRTRRTKSLLLALALATAALPNVSPGRVFRGNGVIANGEPVSATDDIVNIGTLEGKIVQIPRAALNAEDQSYVNDWVFNHRKYAFVINVTERGGGSPAEEFRPPAGNKGGAKPTEISAHNRVYHVVVMNMSVEPTPPMTLTYKVYTRDVTSIGSRGAPPPQPAGNGTIALPAIPAKGGTCQFDTTAVNLGAWLPPPGYHFTAGNSRYHRTGLAGLEATITLQDKPVWNYNSMAKTNP
jgi:hypothetical protein